MLQRIETKKGHSGDIFRWGIDPKDAACLVDILQKALPKPDITPQAAQAF
jgi:hypothetical protein